MNKDFSKLGLNITEAEYRADRAISYSKLSSFYKNGPKALVFSEKESTQYLAFGSLVDCILTTPEEFDDKFFISNIDVGDKIKKIVENIYTCRPDLDTISDIDSGTLELIIDEASYQTNWSLATRFAKVVELGSKYFEILKSSSNKIVVSNENFELAKKCARELRESQFTKHLFDTENNDIFYQVKLKTKINGKYVRMMADEIIVNHKNKTIQPVDFKTTGENEEKFNESFIKFGYWIQAPMYTRIIESVISKDVYFKQFEVLPFQFSVINGVSQSPLIWTISDVEKLEEECLLKFGCNWITLLEDADWHIKNNLFEYSKKSYLNNGINKLKLI